MMGTKNYANAVDLVDFARASTGTALRKISYGPEKWNTPTISDISVWAWDPLTDSLYATGDGTNDTASGDAVTAGSVYLVTYRITRVSGLCQVRLGNTFIETVGSTGTREKVIVAGDTAGLTFTDSGSFVGTVDNISVKEVLFDQPDGTLTLFNHPADVLRINYHADGTVRGLLVEEQRTNLVTYSEDFTDASWTKLSAGTGSAPIVTANYAISPDGSQNATRLQAGISADEGTDDFSLLQFTILAQTGDFTSSIWVKSNTGQSQTVYFRVNSGSEFVVGTEWTRIDVTQTLSNAAAFLSVGVRNSQGSEDLDILIYGAQLEAGSFPTSYIPTEGSQATRAADICRIDTDQFGYNSKEGTVVVEGVNYDNNTNDPSLISISDGTNASRIDLEINDGNKFRMQVFDDSVEQVNDQSFFTVYDVPYKAGMAYEENNFVAYVNGTNKLTDSSGTVPSNVDIVNIGSNGFGAAPYFNGHIKSIDYIPRRLTDEQLQELTS